MKKTVLGLVISLLPFASNAAPVCEAIFNESNVQTQMQLDHYVSVLALPKFNRAEMTEALALAEKYGLNAEKLLYRYADIMKLTDHDLCYGNNTARSFECSGGFFS